MCGFGVAAYGSVGWGGINAEGYTPPPGQELAGGRTNRKAGLLSGDGDSAAGTGRFFNEDDTTEKQQVAHH